MNRQLETDGVPVPSEFDFESWDRRTLERRLAEACRGVGRLEDERNTLAAEVERLKAERNRTVATLQTKIHFLSAEVERLRGALGEYADAENWDGDDGLLEFTACSYADEPWSTAWEALNPVDHLAALAPQEEENQ